MNECKFRAFVDRIEDGTAVLLIGDDERDIMQIPASCLPKAAGEGSVLTVDVHYEADLTAKTSTEARELIRKLTQPKGQ